MHSDTKIPCVLVHHRNGKKQHERVLHFEHWNKCREFEWGLTNGMSHILSTLLSPWARLTESDVEFVVQITSCLITRDYSKNSLFPFNYVWRAHTAMSERKKEEVAHVCVFVFLLRLDFIAYLHSNAYEILNDNIVVFPFLRVHKLFIALVHIYLFFRSPLPSSFSLFCSLLFAHIRFVSIRRTNSNSVEKTLK